MIKTFFQTTLLLATACLSTLSATQYRMEDLGTLTSDSSSVNFIDENGDVMGHYTFQDKDFQFHWNEKTGITNLIMSEGYVYKMTLPNKSGKVVGNIFRENDYQGTFFLSKTEGLEAVNVGTSTPPTLAAINEQGHFTGSYINSQGIRIPFYNLHEVKTDLELPFGDLGTPMRLQNIVGISNEGHVVANCYYDIMIKGNIVKSITKAVCWNRSNHWEAQELFPHDLTTTRATNMNAKGQVICYTEKGVKLVDVVKGVVLDLNNLTGEFISFTENGNFIDQQNRVGKLKCENGVATCAIIGTIGKGNIVNFDDKYWHYIVELKSINNKGQVAGTAQNLYNETHAVIFNPID